jgi:hypothetical protein
MEEPARQPVLAKARSNYDESFKICVNDIVSKYAECMICCDTYKDPHITKCGHSFCKACIEECVNRNHQCPECRGPLNKEDIIKNYNFGAVLDEIVREREREKQKFFEDLIKGGHHVDHK